MTKKIAQSVRIKPLKIHRSGNEKFLVRLGYGRIFGPEFAARTRIFARELKSREAEVDFMLGAQNVILKFQFFTRVGRGMKIFIHFLI